jgi:hypothetical protein
MTLADEVQARYSSEFLIALTNKDSRTATAIDTTVLGYACTDVQNDFQIHAQLVYDGTDGRHVAVAVEGVVARLEERLGAASEGTRQKIERYYKNLIALGKVTSRARITPATSSLLTPSEEVPTGTTRPPNFDERHFDRILPLPPRGGQPPVVREDG